LQVYDCEIAYYTTVIGYLAHVGLFSEMQSDCKINYLGLTADFIADLQSFMQLIHSIGN